MSSNTSDQPATDDRKDRAVLCAKCEHLNTWGRNECKRCGSRLYISCADCGQRNERVRSRCTSCSRRLHHSSFEKIFRKIRGGAGELAGWKIAVFCVGIAIALLIIVLFSSVDLPNIF